ncbi:MAG: 5-formyltetrahydrofolate cyclo-ligase [Desulfobacteraceae bacterium]|nr:5-formyltetrahydrofolate cyclo-ligase [Desulfobacteraceae bacterium]
MDEIKEVEVNILNDVTKNIERFSEEEQNEKQRRIEANLFDFANFKESNITFIYTQKAGEFPTENIIKKSIEFEKSIVLPVDPGPQKSIKLYKISNYDTDLIKNKNGFLEPDTEKCKRFSLEDVSVAIIPGLAFDDKGGRLGFGDKFYLKLITSLPETCRKVALAFEEQIVEHLEMDSKKHTVDIIITDKRTIYKI